MDNGWNEKYRAPGYRFGTTPSQFVVAQENAIPPASRILCPADGEGRNSVYLAGLGHKVTAFDGSDVAVEKAQSLADEAGVTLDLNVCDIGAWDWSVSYDVVLGVFFQFLSPDERQEVFANMAGAVHPGGLLMIHGYERRQIENGTGGPRLVENLYTEDLLAEAFPGWKIHRLQSYDMYLEEGSGHVGKSALIDLVAERP